MSPSSSFLAKKMLKPIDFKSAQCIVEFGPGTGVFTVKLLEKLSPNGKLMVFEINKEFCEELKKINDSRLIIINDGAEKLEKYLIEYKLEKADYIVSSLPLAVLPDELVNAILTTSKCCLALKGKYIQFQYSLNALNKLKEIFSSVTIEFTFLNIPPAFIFTCKK